MATLFVRDLPDPLYQQVLEMATKKGYSLNAYVQLLLEQAIEAEEFQNTCAQALLRIRQHRRPLPAHAPDSVAMIREIRENQN